MPIYQYKCQQCGEVSEFLVPSSSDSKTLACPGCGTHNLEKLIFAPNIVKGNASAPGTTCCGRTERCKTPPCSTNDRCWRT